MTTPSNETLAKALLAIQKLKRKVQELELANKELADKELAHKDPVAIIGFGCRFPGESNDADSFWEMLRAGRDGVVPIPKSRWDRDVTFDPDTASPGKINTRHAALLRDIELFDHDFWGISAEEAKTMDPQQRLLLEVTWEALEHAGVGTTRSRGSARSTGVFVGIGSDKIDYLWLQPRDCTTFNVHTGLGHAHSAAAGRISYLLDAAGPSVAIDTACASSLSAIHSACQSLRDGSSDIALAGGVSLITSPLVHVMCARMGILSPDGTCKSFDDAADGFGRGEGAGMLVLRRLSEAQRCGDKVWAIILGSAIGHNGTSNGLSSPSQLGQERVIRAALSAGAVAPEDVSYVETHGTGSLFGDAIELAALESTIGAPSGPKCYLGSVKSNVGHLDAAAGVCSVIKTLLALEHEEIPPNLHFQKLNHLAALDGTRFHIPTRVEPWPRGVVRRRAAVSAFGWAGQNAHVLLEEPPPVHEDEGGARASRARGPHILPISAKTAKALRESAARLSEFLAKSTSPLSDICFTAAVRRDHFEHRLCVVAESREDLLAQLRAASAITTAPRSVRVGLWVDGAAVDWANLSGHRAWMACESYAQSMTAAEEMMGAHATGERSLEARAFLAQCAWCGLWRDWIGRLDAVEGIGVGRATCVWLKTGRPSAEIAALVEEQPDVDLAQVTARIATFVQRERLDAVLVATPTKHTEPATQDRAIARRIPIGVPGESSSWAACIATLYEAGANLVWEKILPARRHHVPLPAYPWQRSRSWIVD